MTNHTAETPKTDRFYRSQAPITRGEAEDFARSLERTLSECEGQLREATDEIERIVFTVGGGETAEDALADAYDKVQLRLRALLATLQQKPKMPTTKPRHLKDEKLLNELLQFSKSHNANGEKRTAELLDRARIRLLELSRWKP